MQKSSFQNINSKKRKEEEEEIQAQKRRKFSDLLKKQPFLDANNQKVSVFFDFMKGGNNISADYVKIKTITSDIGCFDETESLDLESNSIEKLPRAFSKLENLKYLNLNDNEFKRFPREILSLEKLEKLKIGCNYIEEIPSAIINLKNLKTLSVANCDFKKIIPEIANLEKLDIEKNQEIVFDDNEISYLQNLKKLNVGLTNISIDQICKLVNLQTLYLDVEKYRTKEELYKLISELKQLTVLKFKTRFYRDGIFMRKFIADLNEKIYEIVQEQKYTIFNQRVDKIEKERRKNINFANVFQIAIKINWKKDFIAIPKYVKENIKYLLIMQLKDSETGRAKYNQSLISTLPKEILFEIFEHYLGDQKYQERQISIFY